MADLERVHCPGCKEQTRFQTVSAPVEGLEDVDAVGVVCKSCGHRQHAYFDTPALIEKREAVTDKRRAVAGERGQRSAEQRVEEYRQVVSEFNVLFDSVQADVRRRLRERG